MEFDISDLQHNFYIAICDFANRPIRKSSDKKLKIALFPEAREIKNLNVLIISECAAFKEDGKVLGIIARITSALL